MPLTASSAASFPLDRTRELLPWPPRFWLLYSAASFSLDLTRELQQHSSAGLPLSGWRLLSREHELASFIRSPPRVHTFYLATSFSRSEPTRYFPVSSALLAGGQFLFDSSTALCCGFFPARFIFQGLFLLF